MIDEFQNKKKSLQERFFLFIGILFFLCYFCLGLLFVFWSKLPIQMDKNYRIAFGVLLIVYAIIRFFRILSDNRN